MDQRGEKMEKKEKKRKRWVDHSVCHLVKVIIKSKRVQNQRKKKG